MHNKLEFISLLFTKIQHNKTIFAEKLPIFSNNYVKNLLTCTCALRLHPYDIPPHVSRN